MKKTALAGLLLAASLLGALAGDVTLAWDQYTQPSTNAPVDLIRVYAVRGTNTVFAAGNTNAQYVTSTAVTNSQLTISLPPGPWTFAATAYSTSLTLESLNSNTVWTIVPLKGVVNLRVNGVVP